MRTGYFAKGESRSLDNGKKASDTPMDVFLSRIFCYMFICSLSKNWQGALTYFVICCLQNIITLCESKTCFWLRAVVQTSLDCPCSPRGWRGCGSWSSGHFIVPWWRRTRECCVFCVLKNYFFGKVLSNILKSQFMNIQHG